MDGTLNEVPYDARRDTDSTGRHRRLIFGSTVFSPISSKSS